MTVNQLEQFKYEYTVYENGKQLTSRTEASGDYVACFVAKEYNRYPYSIIGLFTSVRRVGFVRPKANPYAIGLIDGIEISRQLIVDNPDIVKHFGRALVSKSPGD